MRRDLITSAVGHMILLAVILVFNPAAGMFHGKPEIMQVSLSDLSPRGGGGEQKTEEVKAIAAPKPLEDEKIKDSYKLDENKKLEKIDKSEPTKPREKADAKGGLDVSRRVGMGSGDAEGENIGGSDLPYNLSMVLSVIERSWRNPVTSSKSIICTIYFQINRDGTLIGSPTVEKSSGLAVFDQSCIQAVLRAGQFPPFPTDFGYEYIGLHLDFEYAP